MKVKKEAHLRSLTALLRPRNFDARRDPNENCDPWYTIVPSVTHLWTHRPQWRRRHKNRKKGKIQKFPLAFIDNPRTNENSLLNALKLGERPCSRSSTSPYETFSSRKLFAESEFSRNFVERRNEEARGSMTNKINSGFDRRGTISNTRSDSGLQHFKGRKLIRPIRSQKRLSFVNSSNTDTIVITLSNLEVNRSDQLSICKLSESNSRLSKRRVTFSNNASSNSLTDTKLLIDDITMNDCTNDGLWWRSSNVRLTDDDDNCSIETDLSCLISSVNFDESKCSFFSLTTVESPDVENKSNVPFTVERGKNLVYVNSGYSNAASSAELLTISKKNSNVDDYRDNDEYPSIERNYGNSDEFSTKKIMVKIVRSNLSNIVVPDVRISEEIKKKATMNFGTNRLMENWNESIDVVPIFKIPDEVKIETTYSCIPRIVDISNNEINGITQKNCESNKFVSGIETMEKITIESMYGRNSLPDDFIDNESTPTVDEINKNVHRDVAISEIIENKDTCSSVEYITVELKEISSIVDDIIAIESPEESDNKSRRYPSLPKIDISTDTNDLIVVNLIPSLQPITNFFQNNETNEGFDVNEIFNFLKKPEKSSNDYFRRKKIEKFDKKGFKNFDSSDKFDGVGEKNSDEDKTIIDDEIKLLRINTENCGETESIFIEMKNFADDFTNEEILGNRRSFENGRCIRESCESHDVNLNGGDLRSNVVESSMLNLHVEYNNCMDGNKCCNICGRKTLNNPRYIRPVCRVKGGNWSPQLQNDPWINVMRKVIKRDNRDEELIPPSVAVSPKNDEILTNQKSSTLRSMENLSLARVINDNDDDNNDDTMEVILNNLEKKGSNIFIDDKEDNKDDECTIMVTEVQTGVEADIVLSRMADRSTSCCTPDELRSSTSFGFAAFRGPRSRSAKTYFMRESVRTVEGALANRLLCVISETDSLMAVPPFFPKKPPDWFGRRMPARRWSRR